MNAIPTKGPEDGLQQALRREADRMDVLPGAPLERVRHQAGRIRRRRRITVAAVAAAAVVAVTVPTALVLQGNPESVAPPANHTPSPTPAPSHTPAPSPTGDVDPTPDSGPLKLATIALGAPPEVAYLQGHTFVQPDGTKQAVPGQRPLSEFTVYHGGWLLVDANDAHLYQYDSSGKETDLGRLGALAVSGDQMQTAFQHDGRTYSGITTGMGEGEGLVPLPKDAGLVGYAGNDLVYSRASGGTGLHPADGGRDRELPLAAATCASPTGNLVGGLVGTGPAGDGLEGAAVDPGTGAEVWHNSWRPLSFSPDGQYVAATPAGENGDGSYIAILDAQDGHVVHKMPLIARELYLSGTPPAIAWGTDDSLLFDVSDRTGHEAIVRLALNGAVTRATPLVPTIDAQPAYLFPEQP